MLKLNEAGLQAALANGTVIEVTKMSEEYKSEALAAAHETALGLAEAGVMPKRTMKAFDEMCGEPMGAGREAAQRRLVEAVDAGREERPRGGHLM